ncbi:MAG: hypothetical protein RIT25_1476 [Planctomycetota bacterium]|jgi:Ca2+-binding EF-hand superfamily protein
MNPNTHVPTALFAVLAAAALCAALEAQQAEAPRAAATNTRREVSTGSYDIQNSRQLFAACDRNGDGDLDLFEAADAIDSLDGSRDRFRRLDRNRDGFLGFAEFDRHFQDVIVHGGMMRLFTLRPVALIDREEARSQAPRLMQLFDRDRSGELSQPEIARMLEYANLPLPLLKQVDIDRNRSGTLSMEELTPILPFLQLPGIERQQAPPGATILPSPFDSWDLDASGAIDPSELGLALRRVDPQLARWAEAALPGLDRNKDWRLSGEELRGQEPKSTPVADSTQRR